MIEHIALPTVGMITLFAPVKASCRGPLAKLIKKLTGWSTIMLIGIRSSVLFFLFLYSAFFLHHYAIYWLYIIVIYGDDWFANDDDQWKKRWEKAKAMVKWRWLPEQDPHPIRVTPTVLG